MLAMTAAGTAAITGLLRQKWIGCLRAGAAHHATAERLSAALDQVDIGIVLLDADTRAEFINRAFRHYFALPDEKADSKPPFIALMYHGRDTGAYRTAGGRIGAFIARAHGDDAHPAIRRRSTSISRTARCCASVCTALPDGGRMLSYTPVTDLVRHTDDPADAEYYRALRGSGIAASPGTLRAAE